MIWGTALDVKAESPLSLHWTTVARIQVTSNSETYRPRESDLDLPRLFWNDLRDVLGLLVIAGATEFRNQKGHYLADQLQPFIGRVRSLLQTEKLGADKKRRYGLPSPMHCRRMVSREETRSLSQKRSRPIAKR
jgi:hypothetical protein